MAISSRDGLRDAITRYQKSIAAVDFAIFRRDEIHEKFLAALRALNEAKQALATAEQYGEERRLEHLLGHAQESAPALFELRKRVDEAGNISVAIKHDQDLLDKEIEDRRHRVEQARVARDEAVAAVVRPAASQLLIQLHEHATKAAQLREALRVFPPATLPPFADRFAEPDQELIGKWQMIIEGLKTNPEYKVE